MEEGISVEEKEKIQIRKEGGVKGRKKEERNR